MDTDVTSPRAHGLSTSPFPSEWGVLPSSISMDSSASTASSAWPHHWGPSQVPTAKQSSRLGGPASPGRDVLSGLVDLTAIFALALVLLAALTPVRSLFSASSLVRAGARRGVEAAFSGETDVPAAILAELTSQITFAGLSLIVAMAVGSFLYTALVLSAFDCTLGRLVTGTRQRRCDGGRLGIRRSLAVALTISLMVALPAMALLNLTVFVLSVGRLRLRLGQRLTGTQTRRVVSQNQAI